MTSSAVAALRMLHGHDTLITLAAFEPKERPDGSEKIRPAFKYVSTADAGAIDHWIESTNQGSNIYVSLGIPHDDWRFAQGQPQKKDIRGARWVWADLDIDKDKDFDAERARLLAKLKTGLGNLPTPSIILDSGRGYWAFWRLDKEHDTETVESINRGIAYHLDSDTSVADIGHVVRFAGCTNIRGEVRRPTKIVSENGLCYRAADFPTSEKAATATVAIDIGTPRTITTPDELDALVAKKPKGWEKHLANAKAAMQRRESLGDRSEPVMCFTCACVRLGIPSELMAGILVDENWPVSDYVRTHNQRTPEGQAQREIERAHEKVGQDRLDEELPEIDLLSLGPLPNTIPPRPWVIPSLLMDGQVTMLTGKGGDGKSLTALQIGIACAINEPFAYWTPNKTRRTLIINFEDDKDEQYRRVEACCTVMGVDPRRLEDKLFLLESSSMVFVTRNEEGTIVPTPLYHAVQKMVEERDIGCIIIDPLVEAHTGLDENSNTDMKELVVLLRKLARGRQIPILIIHHARKGPANGDQDAARGGSSMVNACRIVIGIERMTKEAHATIGPPRPKEFYVRITDAKSNYAARADDRWMEIEVVDLANGQDEAPGLRKVALDTEQTGIDPDTWTHRDVLLGLVRDGREPNGFKWKVAANSKNGLAIGLSDAVGISAKLARAAIEAFERAEVIEIDERSDENRHRAKVWVIAQEKEPGLGLREGV